MRCRRARPTRARSSKAGAGSPPRSHPRIAPLLLLLRDAADGDPAAAALHAELDANRHARMRHNARYLVNGGHTRPGIRLAEATDVLWTYSSPELFDLLVRRRHWSLRRYSRFIVEAIQNALL